MRAAARSLVICGAAALASCGGGSDATSTTPPFISQAVSAAAALGTSADLVTWVSLPTYAAESDAARAFQRLNEQRSLCGFGLLAQDAQLDQAATAHLNYIVTNQTLTHYETAGTPGFSGTSPHARAVAAGFDGIIGEDAAAGLMFPSIFPRGEMIMQELLDVPYHAVVALDSFRNVGIAYGGGAIVINPGLKAGVARQSAPGVRTYPCEGTMYVRPSVTGEEPSPFPNQVGAHWGPSISVVGHALHVSAASVTGPNGAVAVKAIFGDGATKDPNGFCVGANTCVILEPLKGGTTYQVHLAGTDNGEPFTRQFSFSTAVY